jgi:hypothetical protein
LIFYRSFVKIIHIKIYLIKDVSIWETKKSSKFVNFGNINLHMKPFIREIQKCATKKYIHNSLVHQTTLYLHNSSFKLYSTSCLEFNFNQTYFINLSKIFYRIFPRIYTTKKVQNYLNVKVEYITTVYEALQ